jgi:hypothetical protein
MSNFPDGFRVLADGDKIRIFATDDDLGTATYTLTPAQWGALAHQGNIAAAQAAAEARRLRDLADDQLRSGTGIRVRG